MSDSSKPPVLSLKDVSKTFSTGNGPVEALKGISLDIQASEMLCVLGPSGGGKSTLLNLMAGLEPPSEGEVYCNGTRVLEPGPDRVVIFQELGLFPWLTVIRNVKFGLRMAGVSREERRERAQKALDMV